MVYTIQYGCCSDWVTKELWPVLLLDICCKNQGLLIVVSLIDHFKEQVSFLNDL